GASDQYVDETSPTHPLTAYAKCKVLNENYLLSAADDSFSPLIFRNSTVYGASPKMRFDLVVNNLAALAYTTGEIKMDSDGTPWRPLVHVKDVSNATILALNSPINLIHKQIINIGNNRSNYQIKELAEIISHVFPGCKVSLNPNGADKRNYKVRFDKISQVLPDFSCSWDVEKGARELKTIFENVKLTKEDFTSGKYIRLKAISQLQKAGKLDTFLHWR
ncbi:MAG: SDR family oxidoreductase, partial [Patescibacteria group bacterium]